MSRIVVVIIASFIATIYTNICSAEMIHLNFKGNIISGYDTTGLFGNKNGLLDGQAYSIDSYMYTVDFPNSTVNINNFGCYPCSYLRSTAKISINDHAVYFHPDGDFYGYFFHEQKDIYSLLGWLHYNDDYGHEQQVLSSFRLLDNDAPNQFELKPNFEYSTKNIESNFGHITLGQAGFFNKDVARIDTYATINTTEFSIKISSSVPETSTWMMIILGFSIVGFVRLGRVGVSVPRFLTAWQGR